MVFTKAILYCAVVMATVYLTSVTAEEAPQGQPGFFSIFPSIVPCNYTEQSGATCVSCNQSLLCFGNNIGLQWNCGGFMPNCIDGRCSSKPQNCTYS